MGIILVRVEYKNFISKFCFIDHMFLDIAMENVIYIIHVIKTWKVHAKPECSRYFTPQMGYSLNIHHDFNGEVK